MLPCPPPDSPPSIARPDYISYTSLQLVKSSLLLLQVDNSPCMAQNIPHRPVGQHARWLSSETSAYHSHPAANSSTNLANAQRISPAPHYLSLPASRDQPPASPTSDERHRRPSLRQLIRRKLETDSSNQQPPTPEANSNFTSRPSIYQANLTPYSYYQPAQSTSALSEPLLSVSARSMPPSPMLAPLPPFHRSVSAHVVSPTSPQDRPSHISRHSSYEPYFEPQPPRTRRTFPETQFESPVSVIAAPIGQYQEPDALADAAQYRLFVEATSGLPPGFLDMQSPQSPPPATPSIFVRTNTQAPRPAPISTPVLDLSSPHGQSFSRAQPPHYPPQQQQTSGSHGYSSQSQRLADELERLSGDEENHDDDELPDYEQSQAEMNEARRKEAARRAAELESSWQSSRRR